MADEPFSWSPPPAGQGEETPGWWHTAPWWARLPAAIALWLVVAALVLWILVPVFLGGFGADEPTPVPERVEQRAPDSERTRPGSPSYEGPRPCATVWPTTCEKEGR